MECNATTATSPQRRPDNPTTRVPVPGAMLQVPTHVVKTTRKYRAKVEDGHWILRWVRDGRLALACFIRTDESG